ncbi:cGMP-dependent protein kinase 1 [Stigmatopora nigra]
MGTLRDLQFALQLKIEELRQRDALIDELELELDTKDELIRRLQEELDRYRASSSAAAVSPGPFPAACSSQSEDLLRIANRKTIISEPFAPDSGNLDTSCDKNLECHKLMECAFSKSDLLRNLDQDQTKAVTAGARPVAVHRDFCVIQEGTFGSQAYVVQEGKLDVTKDGHKLLTLEAGDVFGEVALLYDCRQIYTVTAQLDSKLWVIERKSYQTTLMRSARDRLARTSALLSSVPSLLSLPKDAILKMCDLMEEARYAQGDYIVRQGVPGDTFYIIAKGQVIVTEKKAGDEERVVSQLSERKWFGEKALWGEEIRTWNVMAASDVACLLIGRETFRDVIGETRLESSPEGRQNTPRKDQSEEKDAIATLFLSSSILSDFQIVGTLGAGTFGHADLVRHKKNSKTVFAMKVVDKKAILQNNLRENVLRERNVLMESSCPFLVRLHGTFRDAERLFMLTEACLHGDLHGCLKDKIRLDESAAKFLAACVTQALSFLHARNVVYRDVKPENVLLDERGYGKLAGSKCLKKIEVGKKTYTFCGTLGYMAPEVFSNQGHGVAADFWSLGVLVFELLTGTLPFDSADPMRLVSQSSAGMDDVDFPKAVGGAASDLIKELCRRRPSERLGSGRNGVKDIRKHKWFEGFNWDGLSRRTLNPPFCPKVQHVWNNSGKYGHYAVNPEEQCEIWEDF